MHQNLGKRRLLQTWCLLPTAVSRLRETQLPSSRLCVHVFGICAGPTSVMKTLMSSTRFIFTKNGPLSVVHRSASLPFQRLSSSSHPRGGGKGVGRSKTTAAAMWRRGDADTDFAFSYIETTQLLRVGLSSEGTCLLPTRTKWVNTVDGTSANAHTHRESKPGKPMDGAERASSLAS